ETWLETMKLHVRPSTWRRNEFSVRIHLIPEFGRIGLTKLTPQQVQVFYARKVSDGLSPNTVIHIHVTLHHALKDALRLGLVERNVTEMVKAPRKKHREMMTLSDEQARRFLDVVAGDRFEALYVLALTTGMRIGELLALRWQDVDFGQATLQVRASLQR